MILHKGGVSRISYRIFNLVTLLKRLSVISSVKNFAFVLSDNKIMISIAVSKSDNKTGFLCPNKGMLTTIYIITWDK